MPTASSRNIAASNVTDGRTPSAPLPRHLRPDPASTYRSAACRQATDCFAPATARPRSEEHTSELQSLMRISYAVFCLKKKTKRNTDRIYGNNESISNMYE